MIFLFRTCRSVARHEHVRLTYLLLLVQFMSAIKYRTTHALPAVADVHASPRGRAKVYLAAVFQRSANCELFCRRS